MYSVRKKNLSLSKISQWYQKVSVATLVQTNPFTARIFINTNNPVAIYLKFWCASYICTIPFCFIKMSARLSTSRIFSPWCTSLARLYENQNEVTIARQWSFLHMFKNAIHSLPFRSYLNNYY